MKNVVFLLCLLQILLSFSCKEGSFIIDKNNIGSIAIVVPDTSNSISTFSATELKKHLDLVLKGDVAICNLPDEKRYKKHIYIGIKPAGFERILKPEESVYVINRNHIYIFGDDAVNKKYSDEDPGELKDKILSEVLNLAYTRTGTLFAVYNFLENELGIRWIKPGDDGIFCPKTQSLSLAQKDLSWTPSLIQRNIRTDLFSYSDQLLYGQYAPEEFHLTESQAVKKQVDVMTWMRRMRMGRSTNFRFGHAFTSYWERYKNTNPGIFALNGRGERKPVGRIERVKMCPANTDLNKIIVNEWQENISKNPLQNSSSISGCENDSDGYGDDEWCHCDKCMALDERKEGEKLTDYVTDRYVHLWNEVLREARQYKKDIMVTGYAYENMLKPPRREKLDDGILIEFIPRMGGNFEVTGKLYEGWRNAGMKIGD